MFNAKYDKLIYKCKCGRKQSLRVTESKDRSLKPQGRCKKCGSSKNWK